MALIQLPPEILKQVFDEIGSSFFREDLGRLTVCKLWFEFALPASLRCLTLSEPAIRKLVVSGLIERPSYPLGASLETLEIELRGRIHDDLDISGSVGLDDRFMLYSEVKIWLKARNQDLAQLASVARQSPRLRTLCLRDRSFDFLQFATSDEEAREHANGALRTIESFLAVENLTVLVLDLIRSDGFPFVPFGTGGEDRHICPVICALIESPNSTLQRFHLRLPTICPDILPEPSSRHDGSSGGDDDRRDASLTLNELVINLEILVDEALQFSGPVHSRRCGSALDPGGLTALKADLRERAEMLASQMATGSRKKKVVKILTRRLPRLDIQSLDVLTGETLLLEKAAPWGDDGVPESESDAESELLDDNFNGFLDSSETGSEEE